MNFLKLNSSYSRSRLLANYSLPTYLYRIFSSVFSNQCLHYIATFERNQWTAVRVNTKKKFPQSEDNSRTTHSKITKNCTKIIWIYLSLCQVWKKSVYILGEKNWGKNFLKLRITQNYPTNPRNNHTYTTSDIPLLLCSDSRVASLQ